MRSTRFSLLALFCLAVTLLNAHADAPASPVAYFSNAREVKIADATKQNYVVLDSAVFEHARADLGDLRFYADSTELPYAIVVKRGSAESTLSSIPILNKGKV